MIYHRSFFIQKRYSLAGVVAVIRVEETSVRSKGGRHKCQQELSDGEATDSLLGLHDVLLGGGHVVEESGGDGIFDELIVNARHCCAGEEDTHDQPADDKWL